MFLFLQNLSLEVQASVGDKVGADRPASLFLNVG